MNQFRRRLFPSCAFRSRSFAEIFASFEEFAVFAWSFARSFERLADFADFADFAALFLQKKVVLFPCPLRFCYLRRTI